MGSSVIAKTLGSLILSAGSLFAQDTQSEEYEDRRQKAPQRIEAIVRNNLALPLEDIISKMDAERVGCDNRALLGYCRAAGMSSERFCAEASGLHLKIAASDFICAYPLTPVKEMLEALKTLNADYGTLQLLRAYHLGGKNSTQLARELKIAGFAVTAEEWIKGDITPQTRHFGRLDGCPKDRLAESLTCLDHLGLKADADEIVQWYRDCGVPYDVVVADLVLAGIQPDPKKLIRAYASCQLKDHITNLQQLSIDLGPVEIYGVMRDSGVANDKLIQGAVSAGLKFTLQEWIQANPEMPVESIVAGLRGMNVPYSPRTVWELLRKEERELGSIATGLSALGLNPALTPQESEEVARAIADNGTAQELWWLWSISNPSKESLETYIASRLKHGEVYELASAIALYAGKFNQPLPESYHRFFAKSLSKDLGASLQGLISTGTLGLYEREINEGFKHSVYLQENDKTILYLLALREQVPSHDAAGKAMKHWCGEIDRKFQNEKDTRLAEDRILDQCKSTMLDLENLPDLLFAYGQELGEYGQEKLAVKILKGFYNDSRLGEKARIAVLRPIVGLLKKKQLESQCIENLVEFREKTNWTISVGGCEMHQEYAAKCAKAVFEEMYGAACKAGDEPRIACYGLLAGISDERMKLALFRVSRNQKLLKSFKDNFGDSKKLSSLYGEAVALLENAGQEKAKQGPAFTILNAYAPQLELGSTFTEKERLYLNLILGRE